VALIENKNKPNTPKPLALINSTVLLLSVALPSIAQQDRSVVLEEITVTAQKREQNMLNVPISVDSFTALDIKNSGAKSIVDIHRYIPGFEVSEKELTQSDISIRGIKGTNISTGGDPSVATFYDGSYIPRAATTISFSDIERIEVLKGPQGTLFGRNAAAGVLNIVPNAPEAENSGFVSSRIGNFNLLRFEAMANVALTDQLYLRVNALSNQRDGFLNNIGSGGDPGGQDNAAARAALRWEMSERSELSLSAEWDRIDQSAPQGIGIGPFAASTDPFSSPIENDVRNGGEKRDMVAYGIKFKYDLNDESSLKFLASYRDFETANRLDDDGTAKLDRYIDSDNIEDSNIFYTETQFNYQSDEINFVAGINYSQEDIKQVIPISLTTDSWMSFQAGPAILNLGGASLWDPAVWAEFSSQFTGGTPLDQSQASYTFVIDTLRNFVDAAIPPHFFAPSTSGDLYTETIFNEGDFRNYGVYADVDYALNDKLNLAFGLRYSNDKKNFSWDIPLSQYAQDNPELNLFNLFFPQAEFTKASKSWDKITGRLVANYQIADNAIAYASYSTGYKSGGYDSLEIATAELPIAPEDITNIELGLKGDWFDKSLRIQASLYDMSVSGSQRTILGQRPQDAGVIYYIINGKTDNKGIEVVVDWLIGRNIQLGISSSYSQDSSEFGDYYNALGQLVEAQLVERDYSFSDNYTINLDWSPSIKHGNLRVHFDYLFNVDTLKDSPDYLEEFADIKGYGNDRKTLNANISWSDDSEKFELTIWARNISDNKRVAFIGGLGINTINTPIARVDEPRTSGIEMRYRF